MSTWTDRMWAALLPERDELIKAVHVARRSTSGMEPLESMRHLDRLERALDYLRRRCVRGEGASKTTAIHVRDMQPGDVYIGRAVPRRGLKGSKWANPFRVEEHGREHAVELYRAYIVEKIAEDPETYDLSELRGKRLACWCKPGEACHGDVLVELVNR